jgi:hypothetical protein
LSAPAVPGAHARIAAATLLSRASGAAGAVLTAGACGAALAFGGVAVAGGVLILELAAVVLADGMARRSKSQAAAAVTQLVPPASETSCDWYARVWRIAIVTIYLSALDIRAVLRSDSQLRFALAGVFVVAGLLAAKHVQAELPPFSTVRDHALLVFTVYMLVGSVVGRIFMGTVSSELSAALPLLLAVVPIPRRTTGFTATNALSRALVRSLTFYIFMASVALLTSIAGPASRGAYGHEKADLLMAGVFSLWLFRRFILFAVALALVVAIFLSYPAATYLVTLCAATMTVAFTSRFAPVRRVGIATATLAPMVLVYATTHLDETTSVTGQYFELAGKSSNNVFRTSVYGAARERIANSPIFGSLFTDESTVVVPRGYTLYIEGRMQQRIPPHSDLLELWMLGGAVALVLLLVWLVGTNLAVARFCHTASAEQARLARVLLLVVNGFFAVGIVNPVIRQTGATLTVAGAYLCLRLLLAEQDQPAWIRWQPQSERPG